jgi:hypothetical protein
MEKIREENLKILNRISSIKPVYDHVEWDELHEKTLHALSNISAYPMKWIKEKEMIKKGGGRVKEEEERVLPDLPPIINKTNRRKG